MAAVVISRHYGADEERAAVENAARSAACEAGANVAVVPHLYYIEPGHGALELLRGLEGPLAVGGWLYPRPARWILDVLGVANGRKASCVNFADYCCGEKAAEALLDRLPGHARGDGDGTVNEVTGEVRERWYPVVDRQRCTDCRQCQEFCLFGVYSAEDDHLAVSEPDNCKPGCPACARVCPEGAIIFPHYEEDPGIAGAPGAEAGGGDIEAAASLRSRSVDAEPPDEGSSREKCCGDDDGLDGLIEELDRMDDS